MTACAWVAVVALTLGAVACSKDEPERKPTPTFDVPAPAPVAPAAPAWGQEPLTLWANEETRYATACVYNGGQWVPGTYNPDSLINPHGNCVYA